MSKFVTPAADLVWPQCSLCVHPDGGACAAFPGGIPDRIYDNRVDHRKPSPGQADPAVVFKPRPDVAAEAVAALSRHLDAL